MFTSNPFASLTEVISPEMMQGYIVLMVLLVMGGTILDMIHKKSAKYFFENAKKAQKSAKRSVSGGEKASIAVSVLVNEVLTSGEFSNPRRRLSHLLTMYGFIIFAVTTVMMIFGYTAPDAVTPAILPKLWHVGALMLALGGYWFWFFIRVDVSAEGLPCFRFERADLFIVSLLATSTFALIWSFTGGGLGIPFALFILSTTVLFGGVYWSKFAHMFFKPAAAHQKKITRADGSRENLPPDYDLTDPEVHRKFPDVPMYMGKNPPNMGLCIKAERPNHY
ncbi:MAG: adenylyl-sulfate reductase [Gammaproteobacteria bacterium]|nr:adenylyl-sulfate reductase [Gammaproteobacteria bacterium]MBU1625049.1 adenylyl-sulfate reductase [Gammaproteobacteria bacterium]MBU1981309.1 adenylyl-sulfate reductase [Gammaproteobacteria bacterium]